MSHISRNWCRRNDGVLRDDRGVAVTEFGLIAPVFFLLVLGMFDLAHTAYARSVFDGAVERAARASSLETGDTDEADQMVEDLIRPILGDVELTTDRTSYFDFADVGRPEPFDDENGNDICDEGEAFVDQNSSGAWEEDVGASGNGGASDVVIYRVTATYEALFPVPFMPEGYSTRTFTSTAVKKNQPFSEQQALATTAGTCSDE